MNLRYDGHLNGVQVPKRRVIKGNSETGLLGLLAPANRVGGRGKKGRLVEL